jgi:hypothetical protein
MTETGTFRPEQLHDNPRAKMDVLLVIVGGLGDWCVRRTLKHAISFERQSLGKVKVIVVDVHPSGPDKAKDDYESWLQDVDRWVVRRLIEQSSEEVDQPLKDGAGSALKGVHFEFMGHLAVDPNLPDPTKLGGPDANAAIKAFIKGLGPVFEAAYNGDRAVLQREVKAMMSDYIKRIGKNLNTSEIASWVSLWRLDQSIKTTSQIRNALIRAIVKQLIRLGENVRGRLVDDRRILNEWLQQTVFDSEPKIYRYWRYDLDDKKLYQYSSQNDRIWMSDNVLRQLTESYRIIVYVATPPEEYPGVLKQWSAYAERIALEKPIAGLLERSNS